MKLPTEANVVAIPALALYGQNRIYRIVEGRLESLAVQRVGEWTNADGTSLTLVRSSKLQNGDDILVTQLPNAVTGLLVEVR